LRLEQLTEDRPISNIRTFQKLKKFSGSMIKQSSADCFDRRRTGLPHDGNFAPVDGDGWAGRPPAR
jgi:hypothetical protein